MKLGRGEGRGRLSRMRYGAYIVLLGVCIVLNYFFWIGGMRFFLVPSESMEPTLMPRDYIVTLRADEYRRGDIVVAKDPINNQETDYIAKRIVAIAGDKVRIMGGALFINGSYVPEPYVREPSTYEFPIRDDRKGYEVPEGMVFLLGDNRNHSEDSSDSRWAAEGKYKTHALPVEDIIGRVERINLPWSRAGRVDHFPIESIGMIRASDSLDEAHKTGGP